MSDLRDRIAAVFEPGPGIVLEVTGRTWVAAARWIEAARGAARVLVDLGDVPPEPPGPGGLRFRRGPAVPEPVVVVASRPLDHWSGRTVDARWIPAEAFAAAPGPLLDVAARAAAAPGWRERLAGGRPILARVRLGAGEAADVAEAAAAELRAAGASFVVVRPPGASGGLPAGVRAAAAEVRRLEARWNTTFGRRLRVAGRGLHGLFAWGAAVEGWVHEGIDAETFRRRRAETIAPALGRTAADLLRALDGEPRAAFAAFWEAYGAALSALFDAAERALASGAVPGVSGPDLRALLGTPGVGGLSVGAGGFGEVAAALSALGGGGPARPSG